MTLNLPDPGTVLVVDTEGSGLYADDGARVSVVSWAWRDETGAVHADALPFGQGAGRENDAGEIAWRQVLDAIDSCHAVYHNAAHDLHQLRAGTTTGYEGRDLVGSLHWDTMIAARHLDPLERVGLEDTCVRLLGVAPWKAQLGEHTGRMRQADVYRELRQTEPWNGKGMASAAQAEAKRIVAERNLQRSRYDLMPWPVIEPYATEDAVRTLELYEYQEALFTDPVERPGPFGYLANEPNDEVFSREIAVAQVLYWMEERGLGFDAEGCALVADDLTERMEKAAAALPDRMKNAEGKITPQSLRRYYYDDLGYLPTKLDKKTDEYVRSVDDLSRKGLRDQGAPYLDELETWVKLETALTSWYRPWPERIAPDGRLRMRVRQVKVTSGRFSGERVNLLAIPHDEMLPPETPTLRSFIRAAPGKTLYEIDLSQAEVRVGAVAAQCVPLMDEYRKGEGADVYARAALEIFSVGRDHDEFKHYRQLCKRLVLGTLYAMGAKTLLVAVKRFMGIDLTEEESGAFLAQFRERYPEFKRAERRWMRYVEQNGYVPLALGERRYFQNYEPTYKALNQRIQGSVAVGMKAAMVEVEARYPGILLLQTHDSLLVETSDERHPPAVAAVMERVFTETFKLPFIAETKEWA